LAIFVGFGAFFMMEKTFRVLGDEDEGSGSHSHTHTPPGSGISSAVGIPHSKGELRSRHPTDSKDSDSTSTQDEKEVVHKTSKLSAYLNLFGDFTHNMSVTPPIPSRLRLFTNHHPYSTDGLA
jgi:zinc transporter 7